MILKIFKFKNSRKVGQIISSEIRGNLILFENLNRNVVCGEYVCHKSIFDRSLFHWHYGDLIN